MGVCYALCTVDYARPDELRRTASYLMGVKMDGVSVSEVAQVSGSYDLVVKLLSSADYTRIRQALRQKLDGTGIRSFLMLYANDPRGLPVLENGKKKIQDTI